MQKKHGVSTQNHPPRCDSLGMLATRFCSTSPDAILTGLDNPMLREKDDKPYGVLTRHKRRCHASVLETTPRFMEIDRLRCDPLLHMYSHDLASMLCVLVWITSRFLDGEQNADPPLRAWTDQGVTALVKEKTPFTMSEPPQPTPKRYPLRRYFYAGDA